MRCCARIPRSASTIRRFKLASGVEMALAAGFALCGAPSLLLFAVSTSNNAFILVDCVPLRTPDQGGRGFARLG